MSTTKGKVTPPFEIPQSAIPGYFRGALKATDGYSGGMRAWCSPAIESNALIWEELLKVVWVNLRRGLIWFLSRFSFMVTGFLLSLMEKIT
jgi:hypothetical protein